MIPLPTEHAMDNHLQRLEHEGYTFVHDALPPALLRDVLAKYDELMPRLAVTPTAAPADTPSRDINRLFEADPFFEQFMDMPSVFPIVEKEMKSDVTLLGGAIANWMPPHSSARGAWHRDGPGDYVRLTFYLTDVAPDGGPTAVMPGTHRAADGPPAWFSENGQPREIPGMRLVTVPAGTCLVNRTRIWHSSTPNRSAQPRKLIWVVYKYARDPVTDFVELQNTGAFIQAQTNPTRRKLVGLD